MSEITLRVAAKAVIVNDNDEVLVVREASTYDEGTNIGTWGLPGGRLNLGEAFYDGLAREVFEETGLQVLPEMPVYVGEWQPVIKDVPHQIIAVFMVCRYTGGEVRLSEEHDAYKWVGQKDVRKIQFMEPDNEVLEKYYQTYSIRYKR